VAAGTGSWSTQQLAEFLAVVSSFGDEASAMRGAVERACEALDAEVAIAVCECEIVAHVGFPAGAVPHAEMLELAARTPPLAELPGLGWASLAAVDLDAPAPGRLIVARAGKAGFDRDEADLLRGMARVLTLTVQMLRRQQLLERLSTIQRMIVRRVAPREVLDEIVAAARDLLGGEVVGLRLIDPADPAAMVLVSSAGLDAEVLDALRRGRVGEGAGGLAISEDRVVTIDDYPRARRAIPAMAADRVKGAMAAPVREQGRVAGSMVVATRRADRRFTKADRDTLQAFAEHASLALTDAKTVEDALHQAFHDSLTGLPNRVLFADRLAQGLQRSQRSRSELAVLFLDLDRFKTVNDSLGHQAGDDLLVAVADRLRNCIRPGDTAARFGGDEFAVLLEDVGGPDAAERAAMRVLYALEAPFQISGREVFISASIGIATGESTADDPIRDADLAMYRAKAEGKGRYEVFEPGMHAAVMERLELEADLQRAVERGELVLDFQPVVDLSSGEVGGFEALLRWRHPSRGLIAPGAFIPLAEETRLMPAIGRWVLESACRHAVSWRESTGASDLTVSVNLSARQLQSPSLFEDVGHALERSGLPPCGLVLEITETVLMSDTESTIGKLKRLKHMGVGLAVDDFGTGYSSLQYLRRFPIDTLKIDKSFVDDLAGAGDDAALARAIVDLGESFGLTVVAEGIECEEQRRRLVELGCQLGQGFLFSPPLAAADASELARSCDLRVLS
jgi:diguanylate cyclase (GGDEF)-like protein